MVNVEGTLNLARQAAKAGVRRFIYLSSIKVNGEQTTAWTTLSLRRMALHRLIPMVFPNMKRKKGCLSSLSRLGWRVVIIRPPLVYGDKGKSEFLEYDEWLYKGVPLPFGSINNPVALIALDNLIDLIVVCLKHSAAVNQIFLVSDGEDLSTTELLCSYG